MSDGLNRRATGWLKRTRMGRTLSVYLADPGDAVEVSGSAGVVAQIVRPHRGGFAASSMLEMGLEPGPRHKSCVGGYCRNAAREGSVEHACGADVCVSGSMGAPCRKS